MAGAPGTAVEGRRQRLVMVGLVLTFVGLFALGFSLPLGAGTLARILPLAAVGFLALWIGGILLGNSVRPFGRRR